MPRRADQGHEMSHEETLEDRERHCDHEVLKTEEIPDGAQMEDSTGYGS